jgi:hypothetical protein
VVGGNRAEDGGMLSAHCPRHGRQVLVTTGQIDGIDNTDRGIVVRWSCTCGERGTSRFPHRRSAI